MGRRGKVSRRRKLRRFREAAFRLTDVKKIFKHGKFRSQQIQPGAFSHRRVLRKVSGRTDRHRAGQAERRDGFRVHQGERLSVPGRCGAECDGSCVRDTWAGLREHDVVCRELRDERRWTSSRNSWVFDRERDRVPRGDAEGRAYDQPAAAAERPQRETRYQIRLVIFETK